MRTTLIILSLFLFVDLAAHDELSTEWSAEAIAPSAIHNGSVNVMTGRYVEHVRDIRVRGPSLLELTRSHSGPDKRNDGQRLIGWTGGSCHLSCFDEGAQEEECTSVAITEFSGSRVAYRRERDGPSRWEPDLGYGWSNLAWGEISGRTNPKNRLVARHGSSAFVLTKGGGDRLHFASKFAERSGLKRYSLQEMERANGQRVRVAYSEISDGYYDRVRPKEIVVETPMGQTLGRLQFDDTKDGGYRVTASDGQWVDYSIDGQHRLVEVGRPGVPPIRYQYDTSTHSHYSPVKGLHRLTRRSEGENFLRNLYYEVGQNCVEGVCFKLKSAAGGRVEHPMINCVKEQFAPIGSNGEEISVARYIYHFHPLKNSLSGGGGGYTDAYDAQDNRTTYRFANGYRITSIERCQGRDRPLLREGYVYREEWHQDGYLFKESAELYGKVYFDADNQPVAAMSLDYDAFGNVVRETLWGNLTGHCQTSLLLDEAGLPVDNGVDRFSREFEYARCDLEGPGAKNLLVLERSGDRTVRFTYWDETDRPESISIYDREQLVEHHLFRYDANGFLIEHLLEQEGRPLRITRIEPMAIGLPRRIAEFYLENGAEQLIGAVEQEYGRYNLVTAERVFDRENQLRYTLTTEYDDGGRPIRMTDPMGVESRFEYDQYGRLVTELGPRPGYRTSHAYDKANRRIRTHISGPNRQNYSFGYSYSTLNRLVEEVNEVGQATGYTHDALGRITSSSRPSMQYGYDLFGNCTRVENALGEVETHRYTARRQRAESTHPDGTTEKWEYDLEGRVVRTTSAERISTEFTYDGIGRTLSVVERGADGASGQELHLRWEGDLVVSTRDALGVETFYDYNGAGDLIRERCGERLTEAVYDALGREERRIVWFGEGPSDHIDTVWRYDLCGRVTEEWIEDGERRVWSRVSLQYDEVGNVVALTTYGEGEVACTQTVAYDAFNRPTLETDPLGNVTRHEYGRATDREGNWVEQIRIIDPLGNIEEQTYDFLGNLASLERLDRSGTTCKRTDYRYDKASQKIEEIHQVLLGGQLLESQSIGWEYGPGGRVEALCEELGKRTHFRYDRCGRCVEKELPGGQKIAYQYDGLSRLAVESSPDYLYFYRYDRNDQLFAAEDGVGAATLRSYDRYGQLLSEKLANGLALCFSYDRLGRRLQTVLSDGSSIDYQHDPIGVSRVSRNGYFHSILARDPSGRPILERAEPSGAVWSYEWDGCGRLLSSEGPGRQVRMAYDPLGRVTTIEGRDAEGPFGSSYRYDSLSQIIEERGDWENTFQCDSIGNQRQVNGHLWQLDRLNRLSPSDANGCMTNPFEATCRYDSRGRLIAVDPWRYTYDAFNRRMSEERMSDQWALETQCYYLYDGDVEISRTAPSREIGQLRFMAEGASRPRTVAMEIGGELFSTVTSHRGDVVALVDEDGEAVETMRYSAYGQIRHFGRSLSPWAISGKRFDPTGFTYFGLRYYSPPLMRWLSPDPAGFVDGPNLYHYCWNNPLSFMDWLGAESEEATGWEWEWHHWADTANQAFWGAGDFYNILVHPAGSAGVLHGLADFMAETIADAIAMATYVGSSELNLEERGEFREYADYQVERGTEWIDSTVTALLDDYQGDPLYHRYRRKTRVTAEVCCLAVPAAALLKSAIGFGGRALRACTRATRVSGSIMKPVAQVSNKSGKAFSVTDNVIRRIDVTSKPRTVDAALQTAERWLKPGYTELGKPGSGVFRSADGLRQFRMSRTDIEGGHGKIGPHVHFERFSSTGEKLKNIHIPLIDP